MMILYSGLALFSLRGQERVAYWSFFGTTAAQFSVLVIAAIVDLFLAPVAAALSFAVLHYVAETPLKNMEVQIRNGAHGGFWLAIPVYIFLLKH